MRSNGGALTEFGATCRQLRVARGLLMADQARALDLSSAFISSVETGAKGIPAGYVGKIARWLQLPVDEQQRLELAAIASAKVVKVIPKDGETAKFVAELAQSIEKLTPGQISRLRVIINGAQ